MHTAIVLAAGFAAMLACALLGHAWGNGMQGALSGMRIFIPLWLLGAFANMWVGTLHGYSWGGEFPIFLFIFAVPVAVAVLAIWKLS